MTEFKENVEHHRRTEIADYVVAFGAAIIKIQSVVIESRSVEVSGIVENTDENFAVGIVFVVIGFIRYGIVEHRRKYGIYVLYAVRRLSRHGLAAGKNTFVHSVQRLVGGKGYRLGTAVRLLGGVLRRFIAARRHGKRYREYEHYS